MVGKKSGSIQMIIIEKGEMLIEKQTGILIIIFKAFIRNN